MRRRDFVTLVGAGAAWPLTARAQQEGKIPTVGVLWHAGSAEEEAPFFGALLQGFKDLGYVDGENIKLVHRFPNEVPERFRSMVAELVAMRVDVLLSVAPASNYAKGATGTIPHVFTFVGDPVGEKLVDSLARPGGNATGTSGLNVGLIRKNVQLLHETIPGLSRIGLLINPLVAAGRLNQYEFQAEAAELRLDFHIFEAPSLGELEGAFDAMTSAGIQGLLVGPAGLFYQGRAIIAKLAIAHHLPTCVWAREVFGAGALISYGPILAAIVRRTPIYVDKILKGAKPADLPVEQPTKFEFLVNLKTAKALGLEVPATLLARADEVIE